MRGRADRAARDTQQRSRVGGWLPSRSVAAVAPESGPDGAPTRAAPYDKLEGVCSLWSLVPLWRPNVQELGWAGGRGREREGGLWLKLALSLGRRQ